MTALSLRGKAVRALLIAFELLLIYKLWTATKTFGRQMAKASLVLPPTLKSF